MKIHAETRKRGLVDCLYNLGLCISYDRVLGISTDIANKVCAMYDDEARTLPEPNLARSLFTVAAVDNIDHNPSSTTSKDSFHGTGISLMQTSSVNEGMCRPVPEIDNNFLRKKKIQPLPAAYKNGPLVVLHRPDPVVPEVVGPVTPANLKPAMVLSKDNDWLLHLSELIMKNELAKDDYLSWAAYHASL